MEAADELAKLMEAKVKVSEEDKSDDGRSENDTAEDGEEDTQANNASGEESDPDNGWGPHAYQNWIDQGARDESKEDDDAPAIPSDHSNHDSDTSSLSDPESHDSNESPSPSPPSSPIPVASPINLSSPIDTPLTNTPGSFPANYLGSWNNTAEYCMTQPGSYILGFPLLYRLTKTPDGHCDEVEMGPLTTFE